MGEQSSYGMLLNEYDMKLQRNYFIEMASLIGVNVIYRAPRPDKHWTLYSEIESNYYPPVVISCIFNEFPDHKTMKKLGWDSEQLENKSIISMPYDTPNIQVGALLIVPSAFDRTKGRLFRITKITGIMIYPASLTCELVPEFENTFSNTTYNHKDNSMTLFVREDDNL